MKISIIWKHLLLVSIFCSIAFSPAAFSKDKDDYRDKSKRGSKAYSEHNKGSHGHHKGSYGKHKGDNNNKPFILPSLSIDDLLEVRLSGYNPKRASKKYNINVRVKNKSQVSILSPVVMVIRNLKPASASVMNADGVTDGGDPYIVLSTNEDVLNPGRKSKPAEIRINNPRKLPVTFDHTFLGNTFSLNPPRTNPLALPANSPLNSVTFTVRVDATDLSLVEEVKVRSSKISFGLFDDGSHGDVAAGDGVFTSNTNIDTSGRNASGCMSFRATAKVDGEDFRSEKYNLCVTSFPVGIVSSDTSPGNLIQVTDNNTGSTTNVISNEVVFRANPNLTDTDIQNIVDSFGGEVIGTNLTRNIYQILLPASVDEAGLKALIESLNNTRGVQAAYPNMLIAYARTPNDESYTDATFQSTFGVQDGLAKIKAPEAWDTATGTGISVTVLDTGVDKTHSDLGNVSGDSDTNGHGTLVAGVLGAHTDNNNGIAGVAWDGNISSVMIPGGISATLPQLTNAISTAASSSPKVINISSGCSYNLATFWGPAVNDLCAAVKNATDTSIVVAAAGNTNTTLCSFEPRWYPAGCNVDAGLSAAAQLSNKARLISVANTQLDDTLSTTSYDGDYIDVSAPGTNILTTQIGGSYIRESGTSISSPMVAGSVAVLLSKAGTTMDDVENALKSTAVMVDNGSGTANTGLCDTGAAGYMPDAFGFDPDHCAGRIDLSKALASLNQAPEILNQAFNVNENQPNNTVVANIVATDLDADPIIFSILSGDPEGVFSINSPSGDLVVAGEENLNYETHLSGFTLNVEAADGAGLTDTATITINVVDQNDMPVITSNNSANINENTSSVLTLSATDEDGDSVSFSKNGGLDSSLFQVIGNQLSFISAPDYEIPADNGGNNIYNVTVRASDGNGGTDDMPITVTVEPVNDNSPVFTSSNNINIDENTTSVVTLSATDDDLPSQSISFSKNGGADAAKFTLSGNQLSFSSAPDYENPTDSGADNVYNITVRADDGNGNVTDQNISVTVDPVNDNSPVFTSSDNVNIDENTTAVLSLSATDDDLPSQTVTFTKNGGVDAGLFQVVGSQLSFIVAPDYESPDDSGADNVYNLTVRADDGNGNTTDQNISVTVNDVVEGGVNTIFDVDFESFSVGTTGAAVFGPNSDQPTSSDSNLTTTIENASSVSPPALSSGNFARLEEAPGEAPNLTFDNGTSVTSGVVRVSMDVLLETDDDYYIYIRNGLGSGTPPSSQSILNVNMHGTSVQFVSSGTTVTTSNPIGTPMTIEMIFNLDTHTYTATMNGVQVVNNVVFTGTHIGSFLAGFHFTSFTSQPTGFDGVMQLDNVVVEYIQ